MAIGIGILVNKFTRSKGVIIDLLPNFIFEILSTDWNKFLIENICFKLIKDGKVSDKHFVIK